MAVDYDFEQEDFFLRFLQGRMLYFSAAQPARDEFASYIDENRGIRAQKLDLDRSQTQELIAFLLSEVRPENRDYLYLKFIFVEKVSILSPQITDFRSLIPHYYERSVESCPKENMRFLFHFFDWEAFRSQYKILKLL